MSLWYNWYKERNSKATYLFLLKSPPNHFQRIVFEPFISYHNEYKFELFDK